jgi:hypothetical protein
MTLPIDAVAVVSTAAGLAVVGSVATATEVTDSATVGATVGLVVVDPAQAVSEIKPARLKRKITFKIKFLIGISLSL